MMICSIMLMIGHSFAHWARSNFPSNDSLQTVGWRGGHVADPLFRRWVVDEVRRRGASDVLLAAGGNDLSQNYFNVRAMEEFFYGAGGGHACGRWSPNHQPPHFATSNITPGGGLCPGVMPAQAPPEPVSLP